LKGVAEDIDQARVKAAGGGISQHLKLNWNGMRCMPVAPVNCKEPSYSARLLEQQCGEVHAFYPELFHPKRVRICCPWHKVGSCVIRNKKVGSRRPVFGVDKVHRSMCSSWRCEVRKLENEEVVKRNEVSKGGDVAAEANVQYNFNTTDANVMKQMPEDIIHEHNLMLTSNKGLSQQLLDDLIDAMATGMGMNKFHKSLEANSETSSAGQ
jgi:hypothetical protein